MTYSFLLPAYKSDFLCMALDSIRSQTYKDFKVIISDDCSPEDLYSICKKFLDDPRFEYRRNETNIGGKSLIKHWNLLVDLCETDYFILASDDDLYSPNYLEEINTLIEKYPNVDLIRGRLQRIDAQGNVLIRGLKSDEFLDQRHFMFFLYKDLHGLQNYCYKLQAFRGIGGYKDFPLAWFSDDATNILMAKNGCACSPEIVFSFRHSGINVSSMINKNIAENKIQAVIEYDEWIHSYYNSMLKNIPCDELSLDDCIHSMQDFTFDSMINCYYTFLPFRKFVECIEYMRKTGKKSWKSYIYSYVKNKFMRI